MQAIITKYLSPTNHYSARVVCKAQAGRKVYAWDYSLGIEDNHEKVANRFARSYGWIESDGTHDRRLVGGALPDDTGFAFVIVKK